MGSPARAPVIWRGRWPLLVAATPSEDPLEAVAALAEVLSGEGLHLLLLFCASPAEPEGLARAVQAAFPGVVTAGCSAPSLLGPTGPQHAGFVALGLCRPGATAFAHLDPSVPFDQVAQRVAALGPDRPGPPLLITLSDAADAGVERLLVALGGESRSHLGAAVAPVAGARWVFAQGAPRRGGMVALKIGMPAPAALRHTPFEDEGPERLVVTGLSEGGLHLLELDGWPAAQRIRALGRGPAQRFGREEGGNVQVDLGDGLRLDQPLELGEILRPLYPALSRPLRAGDDDAAGALLFGVRPLADAGPLPCVGVVVEAAHHKAGLDRRTVGACLFGGGGPHVG